MGLLSLMEQNRRLEIARSEELDQLKRDILAAIPAIEAYREAPSRKEDRA